MDNNENMTMLPVKVENYGYYLVILDNPKVRLLELINAKK